MEKKIIRRLERRKKGLVNWFERHGVDKPFGKKLYKVNKKLRAIKDRDFDRLLAKCEITGLCVCGKPCEAEKLIIGYGIRTIACPVCKPVEEE